MKGRLAGVLLAMVSLCWAGQAQMLLENSKETRFQIDLKVPNAPLVAYFPVGFTPDVATQGPAKDCNLRLVFVERLSITDPDGKTSGKGSERLAILVAPAKDPSGNPVQLIIGGLTGDPEDVPGYYGNYLLATTHDMKRTAATVATGSVLESQDWVFAAKTGEHLEMHVKYERGAGIHFPLADVRYYSAVNPTNYQISRQEQMLDILRNVTTAPPDRVKEFSLKAYGGSYDKLLDKTVKVLSWDNILWVNRAVYNP